MHVNLVKDITLQFIAPCNLWLQSHILTVFGILDVRSIFAAQIGNVTFRSSAAFGSCSLNAVLPCLKMWEHLETVQNVNYSNANANEGLSPHEMFLMFYKSHFGLLFL
jgi:hypothetical protein